MPREPNTQEWGEIQDPTASIYLCFLCAQHTAPPCLRSGAVLPVASEGMTPCFSMHMGANCLLYWNIPSMVLLEIICLITSDFVIPFKFYTSFSQTRTLSVRDCRSAFTSSCKTSFTESENCTILEWFGLEGTSQMI